MPDLPPRLPAPRRRSLQRRLRGAAGGLALLCCAAGEMARPLDSVAGASAAAPAVCEVPARADAGGCHAVATDPVAEDAVAEDNVADTDAEDAGAEENVAEVVVSASRLGPVDQRVVVVEAPGESVVLHAAAELRSLPGLALSASGPHGSLTEARVRGGEADHLLVLVDGVPANDPGASFDFGALDFAGVERLEYLSGPQSAVWGSDALAGVLLLDTTPRQSGGRLTVGYGTQASQDVDLNVAAVDDAGHLALALGRSASDGTNAALSGDEADARANTTAQLRGAATAARWRLSASARRTDASVDYDPSPPPAFVAVDGDRRTRGRMSLWSLEARRVGSERFAPALRLASLRARSAHFADGVFANASRARRDLATLYVNLLRGRQRANFALEAETERFRAPFGAASRRHRVASRSVAAEYQLDVASLKATGSLRYDRNDTFEDAVAYRLGVTTTGRRRWFASLGRGVKNPTFVERFGFFPDSFAGNPGLRPETSLEVEVGVEARSERALFQAVAFETTLDDEIDGFVFDAAQGGFTARNSAGESRRRGGELRFEARLGSTELRGSYAYVESNRDGEPELRRPRHLASFSAARHWRRDIRGRLRVTHSASAFDSDFSTFPATRVELDDYRLLDASLAISPPGRWRFRLGVENVLDRRYATVHGYRSPGFGAMARLVVEL